MPTTEWYHGSFNYRTRKLLLNQKRMQNVPGLLGKEWLADNIINTALWLAQIIMLHT